MTQTIHKLETRRRVDGTLSTVVRVSALFSNSTFPSYRYLIAIHRFTLEDFEEYKKRSDLECAKELTEIAEIQELFNTKKTHKDFIWCLHSDNVLENLDRFHSTKRNAIAECCNAYC